MPSATTLSTSKKILAILFFAGLVALIPLRFVLDYHSYRESFTARHAEVQAAIEDIYAHFQQYGSWPEESQTPNLPPDDSNDPHPQHVDLASLPALRQPVPHDWKYKSDSGLGAPLIYLHGRHHMVMIYYFAPPTNGQVSHEWIRSEEGDKFRFNSSTPYVVPSDK